MLPNSGAPSCLLSAASPCWAARLRPRLELERVAFGVGNVAPRDPVAGSSSQGNYLADGCAPVRENLGTRRGDAGNRESNVGEARSIDGALDVGRELRVLEHFQGRPVRPVAREALATVR